MRSIRPETSADQDAIRHVNGLAFGQDDEARLVDALREGGFVRVSLVTEQMGRVVGTESYCRAFAKHLGVRNLFQWRHGGFRREMLKDNDRSAPVSFDRQDGTIGTAGGVKDLRHVLPVRHRLKYRGGAS